MRTISIGKDMLKQPKVDTFHSFGKEFDRERTTYISFLAIKSITSSSYTGRLTNSLIGAPSSTLISTCHCLMPDTKQK
jgi:hypothetical protein